MKFFLLGTHVYKAELLRQEAFGLDAFGEDLVRVKACFHVAGDRRMEVEDLLREKSLYFRVVGQSKSRLMRATIDSVTSQDSEEASSVYTYCITLEQIDSRLFWSFDA